MFIVVVQPSVSPNDSVDGPVNLRNVNGRATIFTFLKFTGPPTLSFELTESWTTTMNIYSQVGLVTLVGLVSKNGILIVEFANVSQKRGLSKIEAVKEKN